MKQEFWTFIKHIIFISFTAIAVLAVYISSVFLYYFGNAVPDIIGDTIWEILNFLFPVAAFFVPLLVKYIGKYNFKISFLCAATFVTIYAAGVFGSYAAANQYLEGFTFQKWDKYPNQRYRMIEDLTDKNYFIGMTRDEVTGILGEPDQPYANTENKDVIEYQIGIFSIDPTMLAFELDDGKVIDAYTYTEIRTSKEELYE